ncbi:hypothetical protein [Nitrobacter sp. TKz-YC02]|uniref:hypothetical protein n=1 Tax=Nitrobacter sp. TKz-YC02 TaxID=3398704 RepID=UPI003CF4E502
MLVRDLLATITTPVVLVGHSHDDMAISGAANSMANMTYVVASGRFSRAIKAISTNNFALTSRGCIAIQAF